MLDVHLLASIDESLLDGRDPFLFFDALFDFRYLCAGRRVSWHRLPQHMLNSSVWSSKSSARTYFEIPVDVELDLLARQRAHPVSCSQDLISTSSFGAISSAAH